MELKKCFKCEVEKPRTDFYKHKGMADGLLSKCKSCTKSDVDLHRKLNIEKIRAYDRLRGNRQDKEYRDAYKMRYPNKARARAIIGNFVRDGKIDKPSVCEDCGRGGIIMGHHDDYNKPLEVRWLCCQCHSQWHAINGESPNGLELNDLDGLGCRGQKPSLVNKIREDIISGKFKQKQIAKKYGLSEATISGIKNGRGSYGN